MVKPSPLELTSTATPEQWIGDLRSPFPSNTPNLSFFLEHVGKLRIIVLIRRKAGNKCSRTKRHHMYKHTPTHTHAYVHHMAQDKRSHDHGGGLHRTQPSQPTTKLHLSLPNKTRRLTARGGGDNQGTQACQVVPLTMKELVAELQCRRSLGP
jgi:hypothetical protein